MAEFGTHPEAFQSEEQDRRAHECVSKAVDVWLQRANREEYVEYILRTDLANATELMDEMGVGQWLVQPGDYIGTVRTTRYASWVGGPSPANDKLSLYYGSTFVLPEDAERFSLVASRVSYDSFEMPMNYLGVAFDYRRGNQKARQMIGMLAHPAGFVEATVWHRSAMADSGEPVFDEVDFHEMPYNGVWNFVDCARQMLMVPHEVNTHAQEPGHIN